MSQKLSAEQKIKMNKFYIIYLKELQNNDIAKVEFCDGYYGSSLYKKRYIKTPIPQGPIGLYVALHEIGHIATQDANNGKRFYPQRLSEEKANEFVKERFKYYGIQISKNILNKMKYYEQSFK